MAEGYEDVTSFKNLDLNGMLDLVLNCTEYESYFPFLLTYPKKILTEKPTLKRKRDEYLSNDNPPVKIALLGNEAQSTSTHCDVIDETGAYPYKDLSFSTTGQAKTKLLPRDNIDVVIAIPNIQEPDGLADNDSEDSELMAVPQETMTEFSKKDVGTMAHYRGCRSLIMTDLIKKSNETMAEHRDATFLADSMKSDLLEPSLNVETGAMTEFMKKDVGTMTQYRDDTSPSDSMKTNVSKPRVNDVGADTCKRSNQQRLDDLLAEEDLCSLDKETQEICVDIKSFGPNILNVYAAYKYPKSEPHAVTFIVTVKNDDVNLENFAQYNIVKRTLHCYSNEGRDVIYSECNKQNRLNASDEYRLKTSIERNETLLMQRHRYLNMVSGSAVRSKCYKDNHVIEPTICLVLYVDVKGYVPFDETPFRDNYDGIAIDVREGGCWRLNSPINIGEGIRRDKCCTQGSIGGFVEVPSIGLCGITSAHVLLNDQEYMQCKQERSFTATGLQNEFRIHSSCNEDIGRLISAMYEEGNDHEAGFEIAIFHIERRFPFQGIGTSFQGHTFEGDSEEYSFESGQILETRHFYPDFKCCKYGSSSKFTMGNLVSASGGMGYSSFREKTYDERPPVVLRKQYEVESLSKDKPFATFGDSGALVFYWRYPEELVCTGMIVGCTSTNTTIVSPIGPFLKQLGISKLKNFKKVKNELQIASLHDTVNQKQIGITELLQRIPPQIASENRTSDQTDNNESEMVVE